jgi:hypothetical protein
MADSMKRLVGLASVSLANRRSGNAPIGIENSIAEPGRQEDHSSLTRLAL